MLVYTRTVNFVLRVRVSLHPMENHTNTSCYQGENSNLGLKIDEQVVLDKDNSLTEFFCEPINFSNSIHLTENRILKILKNTTQKEKKFEKILP